MACRTCAERTSVGCLCDVADSDCFEWDGDGSELDPFNVSAIFDADPDNLLSCSGSGLLAILPTAISNPPACRVFRSTNQSIPNNTLTAVAFNIEDYDTDTMHSTAALTTRITFTTAGTYVVSFVCAWDNNSTGNRIAEIRKNGTDVLCYESKPTGGADLIVGHNLIVQDEFLAADYIEALVQQTSGAALILLAEEYSPIFSAAYA